MKTIGFIGFNKKNLSDGEWLSIYNKWSKCRFTYNNWSYFDERPQISTNITTLLMFVLLTLAPFTTWWLLLSLVFIFIGWGETYLQLPIKTGKSDESDSPKYGFYFYCVDSPEWHLFEMLVICKGNKQKYIYMPWDFNWYRSSILLKPTKENNGNNWEHEFKGDRKDFYKKEWEDKKMMWEYNYTDSYDGEVIPTKIYVEEKEWRRRALMWTSLFNKVRRTIEVEFSKEVGSKKGSWKGGVLGCGYELLPNEDPISCIKRMEKERKF